MKTRKTVTQPPEATEGHSVPAVRLVGIGASAGGLEALRELMESLPDSSELCYVIAQHVSPTHVSMLMNLLAPLTSLAVRDLSDGQSPEAGTVFITPPNKDVVLKVGQLRLTEPQQAIGPKPSVNHFFHSLADELGEDSIGIILSGTGSDGAAGLRAIKAAGGITLAQDPDSAKYDGMPKAAIHTGSVDLILRPAEIGPALDRLVTHHHNLRAVLEEDKETDEYAQISNLVRVNTAFRLSDYKPGTVRRRIARRMHLLNLGTLRDYIGHLRQHKEEALALVHDTFISVTAFFRDTEPFLALEQLIGKIVRKQTDGGVIRCWVPGCASGEEAYSIAMLFEEALREQSRSDLQYMIFASDLDDEALEQAREALYPVSELEIVPKALRDRHTEVVGGYCRVHKSIRNRLVFARQNVIEDPPFARLDLISCRNLLIYLNPPVQQRVLEVFHYSLNPGGHLFLGKSDSADGHKDLFKTENSRARIYSRIEGLTGYALPASHAVPRVPAGKLDARRNTAASTDLVSMHTLENLVERFAPPSLVINEADNVVHFQGNLKPFLSFPTGRADLYLFDLLESSVRAELRALVYRCRRDLGAIEGSPWTLDIGGKSHRVTPIVSPLESGQRQLLLISFLATAAEGPKSVSEPVEGGDLRDNLIISELEQELANTRTHLNIVVEELETSNEELQSLNEELQSTNEELQSTNEELQTSNEELQSTNEELLTVNEELQVKSAELETTANHLINVKDSLSFPLIVVDRQLRITQANAACGDIVAIDNPLERSSLNTVQWQIGVPGLTGHVRRVIRSGVRHQDTLYGEAIVYHLHVMPYRIPQGAIDGAVLLFEDITAEHAAESALRQSNERFDLAVRGSSDGLWDWNMAADHMYFSPRFKEILGYRDDEMESRVAAWESCLHPDDKASSRATLESSLKEGTPYGVEYRLRHKSGHYLWIAARGQVVKYDEAGKPLRMAGSISDITQRKEAELGLRESEERNRTLIDSAPDAVVVIDEHGTIEQTNPACEDLFGYRRDELIGRNVSILMPSPHREAHDGYLAKYLASGEGRIIGIGRDVKGKHKDGREIDVHLSVGVQRLAEGQSRFIGFLRDLTERVRAEKVLKESEEKFHRAMKHAPIGKALVAPSGRWLEVNPALCRIVGYSEEELLARDFQSITHPDDLDADLEYVEQMLAGERESYQMEKRYIHRDGHIVWIQLDVTLVRGESGAPRYFISQIQDITERRRAEQSLRELSQAVEQGSHSVLITDLDARIEYVNRAFTEVSGYSREESIGQKANLLKSGKTSPATYAEMWAHLAKGQPWRGEFVNRRKDGTEYVEFASVTPVCEADGTVTHYLAVKEDITEKKRLNSELDRYRHELEQLVEERTVQLAESNHDLTVALERAEAATLAKSAFLTNMSHEIRTPLNGVLGLAQIGYRDNVGRGKAQETFGQILDSGRLLLAIINDILDFSKIEADKLAIEAIPFDPGSLTDATLMGVSVLCPGDEVQITADKGKLPAALLGDPVRISQVIYNLLSNAIKFTDAGKVTLSTRWEEGCLVFAISDTGIGIAPDVLERLFQPFEQADKSTTRKFGGTGLGLVISRRLAELMSGTLEVVSTLGQGSTFTLRLPLQVTDQPVPARTLEKEENTRRLAGLSLLVADDNRVNQLVLEGMLLGECAEVMIVNNGKQAVEAVKEMPSRFDAVLMDVQMPVMDGLEATRLLKRSDPDLPVIGQTAHAMKAEHDRCLAAGMIATVTKPVDLDALVSTLLEHLRAGDPQPAAAPVAEIETGQPETTPVVDWDALERRYSSRKGLAERLVSTFLKDHAEDGDELRRMAEAADHAGIEKLAHSLKGIGGSLCAQEVERSAVRALESAREKSPEVGAHAVELGEAIEQLIDALRRR